MKQIVLILAAVYVSTAVAFSVSSTATPGEWTSSISDAQKKADIFDPKDPEKNVHVPIVAFSANSGCDYCKKLEDALSTAKVKAWMKERGYYFVFANGNGSVRTFVNMSGDLPFIRVVWKRKSPTGTYEVSAKWHGRSGKMPEKSGTLAQQFMDSVDQYVGAYRPGDVKYANVTPVAEPKAGGTVSGGGMVREGGTTTLKATVKSGYFFGGWYSPKGALLTSDLTCSYAVGSVTGSEDVTVTAKFYKKSTDLVTVTCDLAGRYETKVSEVSVPIEIQSFSKVTAVKATGLPSGLSIDLEKRAIVGTPTRSGVYDVTVSAKNANGNTGSTEMMRILVMAADEHYLEVTCPDGMGKVSGTGIHAAGQRGTVKVSPASGWIFSRWEESGQPVSASASFTYVMPDHDAKLAAVFISKSDDRDSIALDVAGARQDAENPSEREAMCGVKVNWPVVPSALSATSVSASGLPAGLKLVKTVVDKDAKTYSYAISGVPTSASKVNSRTRETAPSKAKIKVTTAGRNSRTFQVNVKVSALPKWASGTFVGAIREGNVPVGRATFSVSAAGKVSSGKFTTAASSSAFAITGSGFESMAVAKGGETNFLLKASVGSRGSVELTFGEKDGIGLADGTDDEGLRFVLSQNVWSRKDLASVMPPFGTGSRQPTMALDNGLKLKFGSKGAVTASGKIGGVSVSGSSQLEVDDLTLTDWRWLMTAHVTVCLAKKGDFGGYCKTFSVALTDEDGDGRLDHVREVE